MFSIQVAPKEKPMSDETGLAAIMGGFAQFADGVEALPSQVIDAQHVMTQERTSVDVPHINGVLPGEIAGIDFWVNIQQLELAPAEDLLLSRYDPLKDEDFESYKLAVNDLGEGTPSLPVLPANRNITLQGKERPVFRIYDNPPMYYALIALKRSRIKVHIPTYQRQGASLLFALAHHGQLYREPSQLEICKAAKRLHEFYHYSLDEIATQQAKSREDRSRPSKQTVHYQILVASLPDAVHRRMEEGKLLYTQAKIIAEAYQDDGQMCRDLAMLARGENVASLETHIRRIKSGLETLERLPDGDVQAISHDQDLAPTNDPSGRRGEMAGYDHTMVAKTATIRREASKFQIALVAADSPDKVAVASRSVAELGEWLSNRRANTSVKDIEAVLLGFLEAIRLEARKQGLVNTQGLLTTVVSSLPPASK